MRIRSAHFLRTLFRYRFPLVVHCTALAGLLIPLVKAYSLSRVLRLLDRGWIRGGRSRHSSDVEEVARTARAVVRRIPRLGVGECLVRSLVIYRLLRRNDLLENDVALLLGAGKIAQDGKPALHCWIEVSGRPIAEDANPHNEFQVVLRHCMPNATKF